MYVDFDAVIKFASFITALGVIAGVFVAIFKWLGKRENDSELLKQLKEHHEDDMTKMRTEHKDEMQELKRELCMVNYALLAALDGLLQQGCNGEVTKAHLALTKHINKQAHDQK